MGDYDVNRRKIHALMRAHGLSDSSDNDAYGSFTAFLLDPCNSICLQRYLILCSGYVPYKDAVCLLEELLREAEFSSTGNYTYRKLFQLDTAWYPFFKENAYPHPSGQPFPREPRRGVDKDYVDAIMKLKAGPPLRTLDEAIALWCLARVPAP